MPQIVNAQIGDSSGLTDASPSVIQIDPVLTAMSWKEPGLVIILLEPDKECPRRCA
jgi:hypothetical protein